MRSTSAAVLLLVRCLLLIGTANAFVISPTIVSPTKHHPYRIQRLQPCLREIPSMILARRSQVDEQQQRRLKSSQYGSKSDQQHQVLSSMLSFPSSLIGKKVPKELAVAFQSLLVGLIVFSTSWFTNPTLAMAETDPKEILSCLLAKCPRPLTTCILNPKCLANVVCLNTCGDNIGCQIKCGDYFENPVVGEFNKCVVSDMTCVKQKPDDGSYPIPKVSVKKFDTSFFNGRLYITAGQNPLFDIFPCQVHFFTETEPGKFFGKLNWRVTEPDGEFFTRDALQEFVQDPNDPAHLINHDNEYLHYKDDWYIIDYDDSDPVNKFAFVYYRGSNDAWDGYGGAVIYTTSPTLPDAIRPRLQKAAAAINFDFDKDFTITDNSCPAELSAGEKVILREKFIAGKVALQTESQLQAAAVRLRGNAVNSVKAQKLFFENRGPAAQKAFDTLDQSQQDFEREYTAASDSSKK